MVCCVFSLESPHRGDSNEYTQFTIFNIIQKENHPYYPKSAAMGFYSKGRKKKFETAVVNESSVFEPLKFYCIYVRENGNTRKSCHRMSTHRKPRSAYA